MQKLLRLFKILSFFECAYKRGHDHLIYEASAPLEPFPTRNIELRKRRFNHVSLNKVD